MAKEKIEAEKFIITKDQIDEIIGNMTNRFILKAKFILMKDLEPLSTALVEKFKSFEKKSMKFENGKWEFLGEDWEKFKRGFFT